MSTAIVDGGPCGPDGAGGQYRNRILTDRAAWWEATGGRQGIRRGGEVATVAGQMNLEVAPFLALVEERDASGNPGTGRGYAVWADSTTVAAFDVASASDRMDALVYAFADPSVGSAAFGTEVNTAGGQVVVVTGTSGVTTPLTDSDINTAIGSGGWIRKADVLVESTDTEIQPGNITLNPAADGRTPAVVLWHTGSTRSPGQRSVVLWSNTNELQGGVTYDAGTITLPGGLYQLSMQADARDSSGGWVRVLLVDDNTETIVAQGISQRDGSFESAQCSRLRRITDGQVLRVDLEAASGTDIATEFIGGEDRFFFTAHRVGD